MTNNFTDKKVGEKRKVISKFIKDTNIDLKDQLQRNNIRLTNNIDRVNTEEMKTIYNFVKDNLGIDLNNNYNGTPELRRLMSLLKEGYRKGAAAVAASAAVLFVAIDQRKRKKRNKNKENLT